jgi:hypothetical protein
VWVAFYNYETWNKIGAGKIENAVGSNPNVPPSALICEPPTGSEAGPGSGLEHLGATWFTTCVATETDNLVSSPQCQLLTGGTYAPPPDAGVTDAAPDAAPEDARPKDATVKESSAEGSPG